MAVSPPFMYSAAPTDNALFPSPLFDPKAVTKASWEPKPRKPLPTGPLISSLALRLLQLSGATGTLAFMILLTGMDTIMAWVLRIAAGFSILHCTYAIYHLSRSAGSRTPGSSAAYQLFAAVADLCVMSAYAFGAISVHKDAAGWHTLFSNQNLMHYFIPAVYYTLIGASGLHLISISLSLWLGFMFRKISLLPPDMNPLEDHLTARPFHKKNKSSVTTTSSFANEKQCLVSVENISRPPGIPFLHTRAGSFNSTTTRDSTVNLPHRRYQLAPGSPECLPNSEYVASPPPKSSRRGTYTELPNADPAALKPSTPSSGIIQARRPKFTESWTPTDSMILRTNERSCGIGLAGAQVSGKISKPTGRPSGSGLQQPYDLHNFSDSEFDDENMTEDFSPEPDMNSVHPNPLNSNPSLSPVTGSPKRKVLRYPQNGVNPAKRNFLSNISNNERQEVRCRDIADLPQVDEENWQSQGYGNVLIDDGYYSKPYRLSKCGTPPVLIGNDRKISTGNDFEAKYSSYAYGRRNASGKMAEEGMAANHRGNFVNPEYAI
ncbi:hypothetical protein RJ55_05903 [Drechmeria coniospora]|nr:hypothetical protein RJ55_05903 [Drechmeria coniospora]